MICATRQRGLSYTEVLLATVLIAIAIGPASEALNVALRGSEIDTATTTENLRLQSTLEQILAEPYNVVAQAAAGATTPSGFSETSGTSDRLLVFVAGYDVDNADADNDPFTGADPNIMWLRVTIEGSAAALEVLRYNE